MKQPQQTTSSSSLSLPPPTGPKLNSGSLGSLKVPSKGPQLDQMAYAKCKSALEKAVA